MNVGKLAIATALGQDIGEVERYQSTRMVGVFTVDGTNYTSCRVNSRKKPDPADWVPVPGTDWFTKEYGIQIYQEAPEKPE